MARWRGFRYTERQNGKPCAYCARPMSTEEPGLYPTRDHHVPKSKDGREIVWCCLVCNAVKRDMTPDEWALYRATHDEWWLNGRAQRALNWRPNPRRATKTVRGLPSRGDNGSI